MQQFLILIIQFFLFAALAVVCFYIPGYLVVSKLKDKLENTEVIALSFSLGFIFFLLNLVLWGYLGLRFLAYLPIGMILLYALYIYQFKLLYPFKVFLHNKFFLLLVIFGVIIQGFINFPSGYKFGDALLFWSSQGHDGIWHIAVMEEVRKSFPPQNPLYAGEGIYNYHYFVDLIMGEFVRLFPFISSLDFYFRFFPVLLSVLIGTGSYAFVKRWQGRESMALWAMFFTQLVGSFGFVVTYLKRGEFFAGETVFWASQNNTILGNPPHAIAFTFMITFFIAFYHYLKQHNYFWLGLCFVIAALLSGFKVSAGFVLLAGLGAAVGADFLFNRRYKMLLLFIPLALTNYITFKALTRGGESFLIFEPWWFVRTMVVAGNRLDWIDLEHRRQFYLELGGFRGYARVLQFELTAFLIFLVGNLGMRVIGFYQIIREFFTKKFYKSPLEVMLVGALIAAFLMPMLFIQKGISYNNIQFIQYFFLIVGFYAAVTTVKLIDITRPKIGKIVIALFIIMLGVPTAVGNLNEFYGPKSSPLAKVSKEELQALDWMKRNTNQFSVVMVMPFDKYLRDKYDYQPRPIFAWYSTAYVSAIGSRRTYLSSEEQVDITGYPLHSRLDPLKQFFEEQDPEWNKQFLKDNNIDYIYIAKDEIKKPLDLQANGLQKAFENNDVEILKVL